MHRPIVEPDVAVFIEPAKAMFEPVLIVPFREILARVSAAAFRPANGRLDADTRLRQHVVEFERLGQIRVEYRRAIRDVEIGAHHLNDGRQLCRALLQQRARAKYRAMPLHGPLHRQPDRAGPRFAL